MVCAACCKIATKQMKLDANGKAWTVVPRSTQVETTPTYIGKQNFLLRNFKAKTVFDRVELPTKILSPQEALTLFYKENSQIAYKTLKGILGKNNSLYGFEPSFWAFGFNHHFGVFVERDDETNEHFVYLQYNSHFDNKWYLIATARETIDTPLFFTAHIIAQKLKLILLKRNNFRIAGAANPEIPTR